MDMNFKPYVTGKEAITETPIGTFRIAASKDFVIRGPFPVVQEVALTVRLEGCDFLKSDVFQSVRKLPRDYDAIHLENVIDDMMRIGIEKVKTFLRSNLDNYETLAGKLREFVE